MKKILIVITIIFFAGMLFLTFFAETIHESLLPQVTAASPERRDFPFEYTDENGETRTGSIRKTAVPKSESDNGIFIVYSAEKNGTKRYFAQLADIQTGEESGDYVEVVSGISYTDRVIKESSKELFNGCEVRIVNS